jgi:hypothetical protein
LYRLLRGSADLSCTWCVCCMSLLLLLAGGDVQLCDCCSGPDPEGQGHDCGAGQLSSCCWCHCSGVASGQASACCCLFAWGALCLGVAGSAGGRRSTAAI